jgi:hypothetical protein
LPATLTVQFGDDPIHAVALSGKRAIALGPLAQALEHLFAADQGAASRFRRPR